MENTLIRSERCHECGAEMLWTQNAWAVGGSTEAAYRCANGHVTDPTVTRQCPECGVHDTTRVDAHEGHERFRCFRCGGSFEFPR